MQRIYDLNSLPVEGPSGVKQQWTAIIPAAGRGSRLGYHLPKILYPVLGRPILDWIVALLRPFCDDMVFIVSPGHKNAIEGDLRRLIPDHYNLLVQPQATGMAEAVALTESTIDTPNCLVMWGDQVAVRPSTLAACQRLFHTSPQTRLTLPTVHKRNPYIHFLRDSHERIIDVWQAREEDAALEMGENDCGVFLFDAKTLFSVLKQARNDRSFYGKKTHEFNLLSTIPLFDDFSGHLLTLKLTDETEALGINTPAEAKQVEAVLSARSSKA